MCIRDRVKSLPAAGGMLGIVCDGMGGHLRGDCASCVVAQEFAVVFAESGIEEDVYKRQAEPRLRQAADARFRAHGAGRGPRPYGGDALSLIHI